MLGAERGVLTNKKAKEQAGKGIKSRRRETLTLNLWSNDLPQGRQDPSVGKDSLFREWCQKVSHHKQKREAGSSLPPHTKISSNGPTTYI